jgi:hypothetical protein
MQFFVIKKHFLTFAALLVSACSSFAQLGSLSSDLVYTPITPCRILDTRNAGSKSGILVAGTIRGFWGKNTTFASQGGSATSCNTLNTTNEAAILVNFTVVTPDTGGYITAFPADVLDANKPLAATVNFTAGSVVGNNATLKLNQTGVGDDFKIYTTSNVHVVADIVGYYAKPATTQLDCESPSGAVGVSPNSSALGNKQCSAGYTLTGGGCDDYSLDSSLLVIKTAPMLDNSGWFCRWENRSALEVTAWVRPRCCRIFGR